MTTEHPLSTTLCVGPLLVLFHFITIALPSSILATPVYNPHKAPPQSLALDVPNILSSLLVISEATGIFILSEGLPNLTVLSHTIIHHPCPSRTTETR
ncbi:hypothetical protein BGW80DRAFT_558090 [Lactifluus volemus]|nr:hypothetical protein BGW80DRAFT_558090 [Lactifluus volemus]